MNFQQIPQELRDTLTKIEALEELPEKSLINFGLPFTDLILQMRHDREVWRNGKSNFFNENGYDVIGPFLDPKECDRFVELADSYYRDNSYLINDTAYFVRREEVPSSHTIYDKKTWQIFNVQDLDDCARDLFDSGQVEELFRQRLDWPVTLQSCTIQVSGVEGRHRQPWHVDSYTPPTLKAFVYLNDVDEARFGPFSIVPGSHSHVIRRWRF
jgi:hypothetical protein